MGHFLSGAGEVRLGVLRGSRDLFGFVKVRCG